VSDVGERLGYDRQGAQAEEVHLEQAHVRHRVALVLRDGDVSLGIELGGNVVGDGCGGDERGTGVNALAAGEAFDGEGGVDDLPGVLVAFVGLLEVGRVLVLLALVLVERVGERETRVVGEHLGELLTLVHGKAQDAVGVVDGLLGLDGGVGDDLAHVVLAVDLAHVPDHVLEVLVVEVHVDIGHLGALGREEPLEHEAVLERVEARDVHGIGHDGTGRGASSRADADAVVLGPLDVVLDDEEVVGEALVADDLVLILEALAHVYAIDDDVAPVVTVALGKTLLAFLAKARVGRLARAKARVLGQVHGVPVKLVVALGGDLERVVAGLGNPREELAHLVLGLHVELRAFHLHAVGVVERGGLADAREDVLRGGILAIEVVEVVGRDDLDVELVGHLHEVLVELAIVPAVAELEPVVLDLHVEVITEEALEPARPFVRGPELPVEHVLLDDALDAGALADDALVILLEHAEGGAGTVVHHLVAGGMGHALDEVDIPLLALGKEDQVVAALLSAPLDAVVGDEVGLAAKDGLDLEPGTVGLDRREVVSG